MKNTVFQIKSSSNVLLRVDNLLLADTQGKQQGTLHTDGLRRDQGCNLIPAGVKRIVRKTGHKIEEEEDMRS